MNHFFMESKNIERDSYIWNMVFSMLQAFQSVILLMVLTRTAGIGQAGIFTIAYANANLFLNIGKYGMLYYQVSDVKEQYSFREYTYSRVLSTAAMLVTAILYTVYAAKANRYSSDKTWVIIWMCLYKSVDAIEDVFAGYYQKKGRLDIASKMLALRTGITMLIYVTGLMLLQNQLYTLIITTAAAYLLMGVFLHCTYAPFRGQGGDARFRNVMLLMKSCLPLFTGCFLSFYIGNAPKYAIDAQLSDELQACYGFIAMPVFVIGLLNHFVFNPILYKMALYWESGNVSAFRRRILIQTGIIVVITIVCITGAWMIGIPVLSWMYHTDLSPYKTELIILLAGGGFLGLSGFLNAMITVIRFQKSVVSGYAVVAGLACLLSAPVVREYGLMGGRQCFIRE